MPFTTTGTFERLHNWEEDRINGIEIVTDHHDAEDDNFAEGLSQTLLKDGRAPMEGALNMGGFPITGVSNGVNKQDAVTKAQLDEIDLNFVPKNKDCQIGGTKEFLNPVYMPTLDSSDESNKGASTKFVADKIDQEFDNKKVEYLGSLFPKYNNLTTISSGYNTPTFGYVIFELPTRMNGYIEVGGYKRSLSYSYNYTQPDTLIIPVGQYVYIYFSGCTAKFAPIN